jgi:hypothetical protein
MILSIRSYNDAKLEQLSAHLTAVVDEAMQPASVGLWLAPGAKVESHT